jgi:hypothetical protein
MFRLKIIISALLITVLVSLPTIFLVIRKEKIKKDSVVDQELAYFQGVEANMEGYAKSRQADVQSQVQKNLQDIAANKLNFDNLLKQSQAAQEAKVVQTVKSTPTPTPTPKPTSKPKSTTKTKSS